MISPIRLATLYQNNAARYFAVQISMSERIATFDAQPKFIRWLIGYGHRAWMVNQWYDASILQEAHALTARYLMGLDG